MHLKLSGKWRPFCVGLNVLSPYTGIIAEDGEKALIGGPDGVGGDYLSSNNYVDDHVPAHAIYGGNDVFYRGANFPNKFIQVSQLVVVNHWISQ